MAERSITAAEQQVCRDTILRARAAMQAVAAYDQERVDRLCRAVAGRAATWRRPRVWPR